MSNCDELEKKIQEAFEDVIAQSETGNITDDMVNATPFNDLVAEARDKCNIDYSIRWNNGNYLHKDKWRS